MISTKCSDSFSLTVAIKAIKSILISEQTSCKLERTKSLFDSKLLQKNKKYISLFWPEKAIYILNIRNNKFITKYVSFITSQQSLHHRR